MVIDTAKSSPTAHTFATFYPIDSKGKAGEALKTLCREFGVPDNFRFDGSKERTGKKTEFQQQIRKHNMCLTRTCTIKVRPRVLLER
jgi:hypothetical protein